MDEIDIINLFHPAQCPYFLSAALEQARNGGTVIASRQATPSGAPLYLLSGFRGAGVLQMREIKRCGFNLESRRACSLLPDFKKYKFECEETASYGISGSGRVPAGGRVK
jgi:hypothetical protein